MATLRSLSSLKAYGKLDEADRERLEARRSTRKRIVIVTLSAVILVVTVLAAVYGTRASDGKSKPGDTPAAPFSSSVEAVCQVTLYPGSCISSLSQAAQTGPRDPQSLFQLSLRVAMDAVSEASKRLQTLGDDRLAGQIPQAALDDCQELLQLAADQINGSLATPDLTLSEAVDDLRTSLSAAGTYIETCIDGFSNGTVEYRAKVADSLRNSTEFTSNSLAILTNIFNIVDSLKMRRLLGYHPSDALPEWVSAKDRRLLQSSDPRANADIIVAKDGSGHYKTIKAALAAVPNRSDKRVVIYLKKGVYKEQVRVETSKWNVMMVGDGRNATIITGHKNFIDGTTTFKSATFSVFGKRFIARDMGFQNTAGAIKHQAVALMADSDQSVYYRCSMDAFQDTLYAPSQRQFFRECDIYGTVDFIFGNAAAVFQNCNIRPRVPLPGQQDTITAQGKTDPNQNTGISIHNCTVTPFGDLSSVNTYLGRPWKPYSTTIFIKSWLDSVIQPSGWLPWTGNSAPDTIFYSEFQNRGPGASTKNRVKWRGLRSISNKEASKFTVKSFIQGDKWISKADVDFMSGL